MFVSNRNESIAYIQIEATNIVVSDDRFSDPTKNGSSLYELGVKTETGAI